LYAGFYNKMFGVWAKSPIPNPQSPKNIKVQNSLIPIIITLRTN
jgi:hypothetical protein